MQRDGFDPGWYRLIHGDVEEAAMDPTDHYDRFGQFEQRTGIPPSLLHPSEMELRDRWDFMVRAFAALNHNQISGDYAEFGTGRGSTLWCAARIIAASTPRRMWSFDSFQGLPASISEADDHPAWVEGAFAQPLAGVKARLSDAGVNVDQISFVEGFYADTLAAPRDAELPTDVALAYVDCDLYTSTKDVLGFLGSVIKHGMILAFDDYHCWSPRRMSGEHAGFADWRTSVPHFRFHTYLPIGWHGQSFIVEHL